MFIYLNVLYDSTTLKICFPIHAEIKIFPKAYSVLTETQKM